MADTPRSMPAMVTIKATQISAPPAWAILERQLIGLMEESAHMMVQQYAGRGGVLYLQDDLDDLYEKFYNWSLFYARGADDSMLDLLLQEWNAVTRSRDDRIVGPTYRLEVDGGRTLIR